ITLLNAKNTKFSAMFDDLAARQGNKLAVYLSRAARPEFAVQSGGTASLTSRQFSASSLLLELAFLDLTEICPDELRDTLLGTARVDFEERLTKLAANSVSSSEVKSALIKSIMDAIVGHYRNDFVEPIKTAATLRRVEALIYLHRLIRIW